MGIKIDREVRREVMSDATKVKKYFVMARDLARCRSPKRAYSFVYDVLKIGLENEKGRFNEEELLIIKKEIDRMSKMTPEEFYEELKVMP